MINFKVDNLKSMKENLADFVEFLRLSGANDEDILQANLSRASLLPTSYATAETRRSSRAKCARTE